ncbi:armadillo-type protein [Mycena belliarum]|uniref:Armadillo-type protein n=1 Tax=Mycena belliarum TaxID=1033014 RepID=A0AAD6U6C2_9AGAR|nr:armadillo-type protein [Mycena belliae]
MPSSNPPSTVDLKTAVAHIFDEAQTSVANHQRNWVSFHALHSDASKWPDYRSQRPYLVGEHTFEAVFLDMLLPVLSAKKGATAADRVVRFIGGYIRWINDKAAEDMHDRSEDEDSSTTASRFTARLLKFLLRGFQSKNKDVRYRILFIVAETVAYLGEIDDRIYADMREALLDRIHDKEAMVRVQVVTALSKFASLEDPSEFVEDERTVMQVLIDSLSSDPSPEVRRAAMLNIPVSPASLPALLERTRDTDTTIRRLLYSSVLTRAATNTATPQSLTVSQRELLVRNGLGDRENTVRVAAAALVGTWVDVGEVEIKVDEELVSRLADVDLALIEKTATSSEETKKIIRTLTTFLQMFNLRETSIGTDGEVLYGKVAADALNCVFETRSDMIEGLRFDDTFFANPSPEGIFLARVFVDRCVSMKARELEDAGIPVVTRCAYWLQNSYNTLAADYEETLRSEPR